MSYTYLGNAQDKKQKLEEPTSYTYIGNINEPEKEPESVPKMIGRNIARTAYKVGVEAPLETAEGIGALAKSFSPVDQFMKLIGAGQLTPEQTKELKERVSKYNIDVPGISPPLVSSEGAKETAKQLTGDFLEPHSDLEKSWDESIKTASTMLYGPKITKGKVLRAGIGGFGGEAAKETVEGFGGEGIPAEASKLATMMLASGFKWNGAKKLAEEHYAKARAALPKNVLGSATNLENELDGLISKWGKGGSTFDKRMAIKEAQQLKSRINNGLLDYDEAWEYKRDLNKNQAGLYAEQGATKPSVKDARSKIAEINSRVKDFLKTSQSTHPEFYENLSRADEIYSAIEQSKIIGSWVKETFPALKDTLLHQILVIGEYALLKTSPTLAAGAAGIVAANEGRAIISQMVKSPVLRKYYVDIVKNATKQNAAGFFNSYNRFKKQYEKETEG